MTQGPFDPTTSSDRLSILAGLLRQAQLVWRLLRDPRVSLPTKLIIPGMIGLYLLLPIDLMPDLLPLFGQFDDLAVLLLGCALFIEMCPRPIVAEHRAALMREATGSRYADTGGETVDAEYRVIE